MARKNLVAEAVASRAEVFKRFRDWICKRNGSYDYSVTGLGWTLHDSSYATDENTIASNDYFVIYSAGESTKEDLYYKVTYSATSGAIQVQQFQYWNNTTHVGVNGMTAVDNWQVSESSSGTFYIYANMDSIFVYTIFSTNKYGLLFGELDVPLYDRTVAISASAVSAGSNVVVTLDTVPTSWVVGGKVVIRDNANIERIIISNITGLNVTFTSIANSYAANCKFAKDFPVMCQDSNNFYSSNKMLFGHDNTKQSSSSLSPQGMLISGDPDPAETEYLAFPLEISSATAYCGSFSWIFACSLTGFSELEVYTTVDSSNYRVFAVYSSLWVLVHEV